MYRPFQIALILLLALTPILQAKPGVLVTNDGRYVAGDVDDTGGDIVNVNSHGIVIGFSRVNLASVEYDDAIQKEFADRLARLPDSDIKGRMTLATWALDRHQYELAKQAALQAQKNDPQNGDIDKFISQANNLETLDTKNEAAAQLALQAPKSPAGPTATAPANTPKQYLTSDNINMIRQAELRPSDVVRVNFLNNVRDRYLATQSPDSAATFNILTPTGQSLAIIATGDPSLARDVQIISDPQSMLIFRNQIQPRLLTGCAASGCHNGSNNTSFFLYSNAGATPAWYTNFYTLQTYRTKVNITDVFGKGTAMRPMIDRAHPAISPLAQFTLPANLAANPHPKVKGFKPIFFSDQDPGYTQLIDWMGGMLKPVVEADYGFQFELPKPTPSTMPGEAPESAPTTAPESPQTAAPATVPDTPSPMLNK